MINYKSKYLKYKLKFEKLKQQGGANRDRQQHPSQTIGITIPQMCWGHIFKQKIEKLYIKLLELKMPEIDNYIPWNHINYDLENATNSLKQIGLYKNLQNLQDYIQQNINNENIWINFKINYIKQLIDSAVFDENISTNEEKINKKYQIMNFKRQDNIKNLIIFVLLSEAKYYYNSFIDLENNINKYFKEEIELPLYNNTTSISSNLIDILDSTKTLYRYFIEDYMFKGYPLDTDNPPRSNHNSLNIIRSLYFINYYLSNTNIISFKNLSSIDIFILQLCSFLKSSGRVNEDSQNEHTIKIPLIHILNIFDLNNTDFITNVNCEVTLNVLKCITMCIAFNIISCLNIQNLETSKYYNFIILSLGIDIDDECIKYFSEEFQEFTQLISLGHYLDHCRPTTGYSQLDTFGDEGDGRGPLWLKHILLKYNQSNVWFDIKQEYHNQQLYILYLSGYTQTDNIKDITINNQNRCTNLFAKEEELTFKFSYLSKNFNEAWDQLILRPMLLHDNQIEYYLPINNYEHFKKWKKLTKYENTFSVVYNIGNVNRSMNYLKLIIPNVIFEAQEFEDVYNKLFKQYLKKNNINKPQSILKDFTTHNTRESIITKLSLIYNLSDIPDIQWKYLIEHDNIEEYDYERVLPNTRFYRGVYKDLVDDGFIKNKYIPGTYKYGKGLQSTYYSPNLYTALMYTNPETADHYIPLDELEAYIQVLSSTEEIKLLKLDSMYNMKKLLKEYKNDSTIFMSLLTFYNLTDDVYTYDGKRKINDSDIDKWIETIDKVSRLSVPRIDFLLLNMFCSKGFFGYSFHQKYMGGSPIEMALCEPHKFLQIDLIINMSIAKFKTDYEYIETNILNRIDEITKSFIEDGNSIVFKNNNIFPENIYTIWDKMITMTDEDYVLTEEDIIKILDKRLGHAHLKMLLERNNVPLSEHYDRIKDKPSLVYELISSENNTKLRARVEAWGTEENKERRKIIEKDQLTYEEKLAEYNKYDQEKLIDLIRHTGAYEGSLYNKKKSKEQLIKIFLEALKKNNPDKSKQLLEAVQKNDPDKIKQMLLPR